MTFRIMKVPNPVTHEIKTHESRAGETVDRAPGLQISRILQKSRIVCALFLALLLAFNGFASPSSGIELEAILLWGTNEQKSPDPNHKPVGPELRKLLQGLPLKWTNYFEVNRIKFDVTPSGVNKVPLSKKFALEVKNQGHEKIEVAVFGKGKQVATRTQELPKHGTLILGGDSPGTNCWLAIVKRLN
jgi:hypothetical protein